MDMEGLSTICAGLGIADEDENGNRIGYTKEEYCLDNLKDLLRFLRRDDPQTREVFKQVCKWNIVSKDLIPIIEHNQDDRNLVLNAVKVLVFLSMPVEPSSSDIPQQIEYLWELKSSITSSNTVPVIISLLEGPLENLELEAFTEDDWKLVQLVLTFFRNILAVQDVSSLQKSGEYASQLLSLRDRFLELLFRENVMDLIIVITQHVSGSRGYLRHDNLLLLEIFHYIFTGQEPELIARAHLRNSKEGGDAKASIDGLKSIMEEEKEKRKLCRMQNASRHTQFSGMFTRLTMDGSKAVFKGNPGSVSQNALLKSQKGQRGRSQKIVWEHGRLPSIKSNIVELLHDFVNQFLTAGYSVLMQSIHEDVEKEHHAIQNGDIIVFFKVAEFVISFQYQKFLISKPIVESDASEVLDNAYADSTLFKGNICGPIAASMNESMFQLVISRWRNAFEGLKENNDRKFLSAAGSLMKNMIRMLDLVLKLLPEDSREPQTARILLYKLFYDQTDQGMTHFLLNLIKVFDIRKQPKSDLADLVEIMHVIVRLMQNLQARGSLRVSRKSRTMRKKKATIDKNIENNLSEGQDTSKSEFGTSCGEQSEEFSISRKTKQISSTSHGEKGTGSPPLVDEPRLSESDMGNKGGDLQEGADKLDQADAGLCCSTDDSSSDEQPTTANEVDFKVSTFISAFANSNVIQNLCWLLKFYRSNSANTNHYIICMLRRITEDLELAPMLYQLSLLTTFYDILAEQKSCPSKDHANVVDFIKQLVRNMLKKMKNQPLLFIEVLFWKTRKECHYINAEYLLHELGSWRKESRNLGNDLANGEIGSSQAKEWTHRSLADALGEDEGDVVFTHELGPQNESNSMENDPEKISKRKRRLVLSDDLEGKIKDLYEKYKDDPNCSRLIAESLDPDGKILPAQVSNKLKQLGLKAAAKKRMRYSGGPLSAGPNQQGDESAIDNKSGFKETSPEQTLSTRKRVCAFSKEQEAMIKDLFEQFKNHKRCSYLIANALDADNAFTAAQVSRKLKSLGLHIPRQKRSKASMELGDEKLDDFSAEETHDSDNETLLSFRRRSRERDSYASLSKDLPVQKMDGEESEDDDEILRSIFKKTTKVLRKLKDEKLIKISTRAMIDENSRDQSDQGAGMDAPFPDDDRKGASKAEATGTISENPSSASPFNVISDLPHQQLEDEIADSVEDMASDSFVKSAINRRKLRMVLDLEDDD